MLLLQHLSCTSAFDNSSVANVWAHRKYVESTLHWRVEESSLSFDRLRPRPRPPACLYICNVACSRASESAHSLTATPALPTPHLCDYVASSFSLIETWKIARPWSNRWIVANFRLTRPIISHQHFPSLCVLTINAKWRTYGLLQRVCASAACINAKLNACRAYLPIRVSYSAV